MNIAVQSADLDASRIDGTRVYLLRLLERFGQMAPEETWHLYHRYAFNPLLTPPHFPNYEEHRISAPFFWTQTRFALDLFRLQPDRVFMPVQSVPFFLPKETQSIATIHDLAFKLFPESFPAGDLRRLTWFTATAIRKATRLIAVSESTKRDILRFYPETPEAKIRVIHHGYDAIPSEVSPHDEGTLARFNLRSDTYFLYVGAIQPRKNLGTLLRAFELVAGDIPESVLALVGEAAWMSDGVLSAIEAHPFRDRIRLMGRATFEERAALYRHARAFIFPSLYEGFGLPVLEAFSAGIPSVVADNSSLPEVAGDGALLFDAQSPESLVSALTLLWRDEHKRSELIVCAHKQLEKFSWDQCARETIEWITGRG